MQSTTKFPIISMEVTEDYIFVTTITKDFAVNRAEYEAYADLNKLRDWTMDYNDPDAPYGTTVEGKMSFDEYFENACLRDDMMEFLKMKEKKTA